MGCHYRAGTGKSQPNRWPIQFLVLNGQIKPYRLSPEGNEKIIDIVQPGNSFAEALMFLDAPLIRCVLQPWARCG